MLPELLLEHCFGRRPQRQSQRGGWCPACSETPGPPHRGCHRGRPHLWGSPDPTSRLTPLQRSTCQQVADKLPSELEFHSGQQDSCILFVTSHVPLQDQLAATSTVATTSFADTICLFCSSSSSSQCQPRQRCQMQPVPASQRLHVVQIMPSFTSLKLRQGGH